MHLTFHGAAGEVTGSKHLITTDDGVRILLDCGMYQGKGQQTDEMNRDLGFDPASIDYLILSHAHIDHSGLIPFITKLGFQGRIVTTPATRDLCSIMLADSGHIQEYDTRINNKKRARQGLPPLEPIYNQHDARKSLNWFLTIPLNNPFPLHPGITLTFTDTGHILGSAAINLAFERKNGETTRLCYTGDIGRYDDKILRSPQAFPQADYIITESTYGDRLHDSIEDAEDSLLEVVRHTCVEKKGKLIIPSFSVGRTQQIVYALDRLESSGRLPRIDVYVDSPLSVNATDIFRLHPECFNEDILEYMEKDEDPFGFGKLYYIREVEKSKALNARKDPCIIISASGMMEAGRVKHHISNNIEDPRATILAVGYCAPSTLGARLLKRPEEISIFGRIHQVKAEILQLHSLSAHGDYREMHRYLSCQDKAQVKTLFLVHGEDRSRETYRNYLQENGFAHIETPQRRDYVEI